MSDAGNLETVDVVRQELRLFLSLADRIGIDGDRQRRFLRMSQGEWQQLLAANARISKWSVWITSSTLRGR